MKSTLALLGLATTALIVGSCGMIDSNPTGSLQPTRMASGIGLLPPGSVFDSAQLVLNVRRPGGLTIAAYPAQTAWDEMTVSWSTLGSGLSPFVVARFSALDTGDVTMDVSGAVSLWLDEVWVNYGFILDQSNLDNTQTRFASRECGLDGPRLKVFGTSNGVSMMVTLRPTADAYVDQDLAGANAGADTSLFSGATGTGTGEYRSLIRFDLTAEPVAGLGDRVWNDLNADGIQDVGEPGMSNVPVNLYDCGGLLLHAATTDANGIYRFDSLSLGEYLLEFVPPPGYVFSPPAQGFDGTMDNDVDVFTGRTVCITLSDAVNDYSWDAGLYLVPAEPDSSVCTHGKGYWQHRAGFQTDVDEVSDLLPITLGLLGGAKSVAVETAKEAVEIFHSEDHSSRSNGIAKLYAHLLAAKLNVAAGAVDDDIADVIADADAFLANYGLEDWGDLNKGERHQVLYWKDMLESYNEGEIGPGSCAADTEGESVG